MHIPTPPQLGSDFQHSPVSSLRQTKYTRVSVRLLILICLLHIMKAQGMLSIYELLYLNILNVVNLMRK